MNFDLSTGYSEALSFTRNHYENFPVISFILPNEFKKHIAIIYWFARTADDLADEGNFNPEERIKKLDEFRLRLESLIKGNCTSHLEHCLLNTINEKKLTSQYFFDLLFAFKQDVTKSRYENFDEVINYCKHSANPVGRLILELFGYRDEKLNVQSDKICSALQITNFLQDTLIDFNKGRIYLPQDELKRFGVDEKMFELKENNLNLKRLIEFNVERAQKMFNEGKELLHSLNGGLKIEISWTVNGGERILNKIRKNDFNVLNRRPTLNKYDFASILLKSLILR